MLDPDFARAQFPAFAEPSLDGWAFFENAGGSYACRQVIDRLTRFYRERKMQPYGAAAPSAAGGAEMDEARERLSALLGVACDELSFGPSTTQNAYVLAQAFRRFLSPGEAIVVTDQDHEANSGPWRRLAEAGIEIREWKMNPATGQLDPDDLAPLLDDTVRLVCFPHCSNVVGATNPVAEITALAHAAGAFTCVDGVSHAPHGFPDIGALGCDIYLFSAYKTYGPHQGIMTIRRALAEVLPNEAHFFNGDTLYKKFTPAGPDHAQVAACAGMVDYVEALGAHHACAAKDVAGLMHDRETMLLQPLLDWAASRNGLRLLGPREAERRAPTVALDLGRPAAPVAAALAEHGIIAGGGDFYAVRALRALGVDPDQGVLRLSFVHYTTEEEVARAIEALERVI
ncbi:aminotransferase class V-fold PLP-dependent enzyme [Salipiger mucosus]|nr:aminotransferase class V-fold PLP-dependent enzyme [Salipiger mucosus]